MFSKDSKASACHVDISAKERDEGRAGWKRNGLEPPADICFNWISCKKPPLHWEPLYSTNPIEVKLANMTAALDAGADPNELDHELHVRECLGRPLHCCIGGLNAWGSPHIIRLNLPLIELLLSRGVDPRLQGPGLRPRLPSPLEMVRLEVEENSNPDDGEKMLQDCGFYAEALKMLRSAADALDSESPRRKGAYVSF